MSRPRVLILEDEFFVAVDLESMVQTHLPSAEIVLCTSVAEAEVALKDPVGLALLDIDVLDGKSFPIAMTLTERNVPFVFVSSASIEELPSHLSHAPFVSKPYSAPLLDHALQTVISQAPSP